ncbi:acetolactate synthase small subunit, partial [Candidatus Bathyarchaeota archaeon]|nr:acetolactate synthase small subunit [Candidatus Bathyarchaeota archaeon]
DDHTVEQIVKQLHKIIAVIKVSILDPEKTIAREMALIKVHTVDAKARSDIIQYANIFRCHIVDISSESIIVEITGDSEKIDAFIDISRPFGVKEIARTGITALTRGGKVIKE